MKPRSGAIYVAASKEGPVKIGISVDPWQRIAHLVHENGTPECELKFIVECESRNDARRIESAVKSDLWRKCHKGEWFNVSVKEMIQRISGIAEELRCRTQFIPPILIQLPPAKPRGGLRPRKGVEFIDNGVRLTKRPRR